MHVIRISQSHAPAYAQCGQQRPAIEVKETCYRSKRERVDVVLPLELNIQSPRDAEKERRTDREGVSEYDQVEVLKSNRECKLKSVV